MVVEDASLYKLCRRMMMPGRVKGKEEGAGAGEEVVVGVGVEVEVEGEVGDDLGRQ